MNQAKLVSTLAVTALISASPAFADKVKTVRSGVATQLGVIYQYYKYNCKFEPPASWSVLREPKHGSVKLRTQRVTLGKDTKCPGAKGKAVMVVYQSNRGYRGKDSFAITYTYQQTISYPGPPASFTVKVEVK